MKPRIHCWRCGGIAAWHKDSKVYVCDRFGCGIDIPAQAEATKRPRRCAKAEGK